MPSQSASLGPGRNEPLAALLFEPVVFIADIRSIWISTEVLYERVQYIVVHACIANPRLICIRFQENPHRHRRHQRLDESKPTGGIAEPDSSP